MTKTVEYVVLSYEPNVPEESRFWHGKDLPTALRVLAEMMERYPGSPLRFTTHESYSPLS